MKTIFLSKAALAAALMLQAASVSTAEQMVTLGDSLTFAYEAEFGFEVSVPLVGTFGDGFGPEVRNWAEILNDPAFRESSFSLGARDNLRMSVPFVAPFDLFFRHKQNWAIPGLKVDQLRGFMSGEVTILDLLDEGSQIALFLEYSDFDETTDFALADLEMQIRDTAERLVFFIGGNDITAIYGDVYDGLPAGTFVEDFLSDAAVVLDRVQELNPNLQIVVVNVPHVGITPLVKFYWPTDPEKTERVTAVLRELNRGLADLAAARGLGYADIFTPTLALLGTTPLCIHGITFVNDGSTSGDLDYVWLNGPTSENFHPNTNAQAIIANEIIGAFNQRYQTGIAPLSATEILANLHGKDASQIDMTFVAWMDGHSLAGLSGNDDGDGDGTVASVEFALGLNPTLRDSHKIQSSLMDNGGSMALELAYPIRLPLSSRYSLSPAFSYNLSAPFTRFSIPPMVGPDGMARAQIPLAGTTGFLRLESTVMGIDVPVLDSFVLIPAGSFQMGDSLEDGTSNELPVHSVYVSGFYMGKHEVTKTLWDDVRAWGLNNDYTDIPVGAGKAANHPVHSINWHAMVKWCNARSQKEGLTPCYTVAGAIYKTGSRDDVVCNWSANGYRLPSEAEWEKAARGGASGKRYPWGTDTISHAQANYKAENLEGYPTYGNLSGDAGYHPDYYTADSPYSSPVGSFAPNGYGLYDMAGNIWEWCWDWYSGDYYLSSPGSDPGGPSAGSYRVLRGGDWLHDAYVCRVTTRGWYHPSFGSDSFGFRLARQGCN